MRNVCGSGWAKGLAFLGIIGVGLSACSLEKPVRHFTLKIDTARLEQAFDAKVRAKPALASQSHGAEGVLALPTQFFSTAADPSSGFACLAVNLTGSTVPKRTPPHGAQFCPAHQPKEFAAMATLVPLVSGQTEVQASLSLPAVGTVGIEIWGVQSENGLCPSIAPGAPMPQMRAQVFRLATQSVVIGQDDVTAQIEIDQSNVLGTLESNRVFCEPPSPVPSNISPPALPAGSLSYSPSQANGSAIPRQAQPSWVRYAASLVPPHMAQLQPVLGNAPNGVTYRLKSLQKRGITFVNPNTGSSSSTLISDVCADLPGNSVPCPSLSGMEGVQGFMMSSATGLVDVDVDYATAFTPGYDAIQWLFDIQAYSNNQIIPGARVVSFSVMIDRPQVHVMGAMGQGFGNTFQWDADDFGVNDQVSFVALQEGNQPLNTPVYIELSSVERRQMRNEAILEQSWISQPLPGVQWGNSNSLPEFYVNGLYQPVLDPQFDGGTGSLDSMDVNTLNSSLLAWGLHSTHMEYVLELNVYTDSSKTLQIGESSFIHLKFNRVVGPVAAAISPQSARFAQPASSVDAQAVVLSQFPQLTELQWMDPSVFSSWGSASSNPVAGSAATSVLVFRVSPQERQAFSGGKFALEFDVRGPVEPQPGYTMQNCALGNTPELFRQIGSVRVELKSANGWVMLDDISFEQWDSWKRVRILDRTLSDSLVDIGAEAAVLIRLTSLRPTSASCLSRVGAGSGQLLFVGYGVNQAPSATPTTLSMGEDEARTFTLQGVDPENAPLTYAITTQPTHGVISGFSPSTGTFIYTPTLDFNGTDSLQFTVSDGLAVSSPSLVNISIAPTNDAPVANSQSISLNEDTAYGGTLAGSDVDGQAISFSITTAPGKGTVVITNPATGAYTYTPGLNQTGADSFQFRVNDGLAYSQPASVQITINPLNDAPVASGGSFTMNTGATYSGLLPASDVDSAQLSYSIVTAPSIGTMVVNNPSTGAFTYTASDTSGSTSFTYRVSDGVLSATGTMNIVVGNGTQAGTNTAPTLTAVTTLAGGTRNAVYTITYAAMQSAANEADLDNDVVNFRVGTVTSGTLTQGGSAVTANSTLLTSSSQPLVWTPAFGVSGAAIAAFTVQAHDGTTVSASAITVSVAVSANTAPTLTSISTLTGGIEDTAYSITFAALAAAANEVDLNVDAISFRISAVSTGTLTKSTLAVVAGSTTIASGETVVWTPASNANGTLPAFTVFAVDSQGSVSASPVQVSVSVAPVNDAPGLTGVAFLSGTEDTIYTLTYEALAGATLGATDVDGDAIRFRVESVLTGTLTKGGVTVTAGLTTLASGESLVWTPVANANGSQQMFNVRTYDGSLASAGAVLVNISLVAVNDAPTLGAIGNTTISEDAGLQTVSLAGISTGAPNETQTLIVTASSSNTALIPVPAVTYMSPNATGSLSFTPVANAFGTATITVTVSDGMMQVNRMFTVTVNPINDPPTLAGITSMTILKNSSQQTVSLTGITVGPPNEAPQTLTISATSSNTALIPNPTIAYTSPNATGTLMFTPVANVTGTATITVLVSDGEAANATVMRTFTVTVQ